MGMDVRGLAPSALAGQEFRANIDWHLLITLVKRLCPDEAAPCKHWESNDGDGLDAAGASALAAKLEALMANGDVATYCAERDAHIATLPREKCHCCGGTGRHTPSLEDIFETATVGVADIEAEVAKDPGVGPCPLCDGSGTVENRAKGDRLRPNDVAMFLEFLKTSGGFVIR